MIGDPDRKDDEVDMEVLINKEGKLVKKVMIQKKGEKYFVQYRPVDRLVDAYRSWDAFYFK